MRTCGDYEALISAFIDGTLEEDERVRLMEHMAVCTDCQAYFDDQIAIHDALTSLEAEAPEDFTEKVMEKVRSTAQDRAEPERKSVLFPHWRRWTALAACCAVAALGVWTFGGQNVSEDAALLRSAAPYSSGYEFDADEAEEPGTDRAALDNCMPPSPEESPDQDSVSSKQAADAPEAAVTTAPACDDTAAERTQRDSQYVTVLTTASPTAADWVEKKLGEPWEACRGYNLTEEQYEELLALLERDGAEFTLHRAEKEPHWYELRME